MDASYPSLPAVWMSTIFGEATRSGCTVGLLFARARIASYACGWPARPVKGNQSLRDFSKCTSQVSDKELQQTEFDVGLKLCQCHDRGLQPKEAWKECLEGGAQDLTLDKVKEVCRVIENARSLLRPSCPETKDIGGE